jgi:hypothetical protein
MQTVQLKNHWAIRTNNQTCLDGPLDNCIPLRGPGFNHSVLARPTISVNKLVIWGAAFTNFSKLFPSFLYIFFQTFLARVLLVARA